MNAQLVDEVITVDKNKKSELVEKLAAVASREFDIVLCPHRSLRSARLVRAIRAPRKIGFARWWNRWMFTDRLRPQDGVPDALRQLSLLRPLSPEIELGFKEIDEKLKVNPKYFEVLDSRETLGRIPEWASMAVSYTAGKPARLGTKPLIFFAPGSVWATKRWQPQGFVEIGRRLASEGNQIVIIGSPDEHRGAEAIKNQIPGAINVAGEPGLFELGSWLAHGTLMVTNDNGAMHLGATANIPTVAIFGPTVLRFGYRPWNNRALVVENSKLACRPCGVHGHKVCPLGTHECMKSVTSTDVLKAARELGKN